MTQPSRGGSSPPKKHMKAAVISNSDPDLFDICAGRHRGNPESETANDRVAGKKGADRHRVLMECRRRGGVTCKELSDEWGVGMNQISGRFTELKRLGLIKKVGVRGGSGIMCGREARA